MRVVTLDAVGSADATDLLDAVRSLRAGGIVAYVTETVYGLACDATNASACDRLAALKGREEGHPFPVQVFRPEPPWWTASVPETARALFRAFAPGPITVVLPGDPRITVRARGPNGSVGLRVPDHPVALAVLEAFGGPLACPSANRTGLPPARDHEEIAEMFPEGVDIVLTGAPPPFGTPSTVVDVTGEVPRILRVGAIVESEVWGCLDACTGR